MKKTLLFSSILTSGLIAAQSASAAAGGLTGLFYKPAEGDVVSVTSFRMENREAKFTSNNTDYELDTNEISETIRFGVNERLSLDFDIDYQEVEETSGTSTVDADGLTNPEIELNYRIADQNSQGFFSDLRISYAPDVFERETGDSTNDATVAQGGDVFGFGIDYGRDNDNLSYKVSLDAIHNGDIERESAATGNRSTSADATTDVKIAIAGQYRTSDELSIDASLTQTIPGNQTDGDGDTINGQDSTALALALNYALDPENSVITVGYIYTKYDDQTVVVSGVESESTYDEEANEFSISYSHRF